MIFTVMASEQGMTVAEFLLRRIPAASQGYLRQLTNKGKVSRRKNSLAWQDILASDDVIRLPDSQRLKQLIEIPPPESGPLNIFYESREILIVDKPSGLATHRSLGHENDDLTSRVEALLCQRNDNFSVAPVHRLDLETSGPVLFGKGKRSASELGKMFMRQEVDKYYLALVVGRTQGAGRLRSEVPSKGKIKEAVTEYRATSRNDLASLLELKIETGRQHQIRHQLAEIGHPVYGDLRYGGPRPDGLVRMFLHCSRLSFVDPFSGAQLDIESQLPEELKAFTCQYLGE